MLIEEGDWKAEKEDGVWWEWNADGSRKWRGMFRKGVPHGFFTEWDANGKVNSTGYHLNGTQVTRSEYLAACAKDPTLPKPPDEPKKPKPKQPQPPQTDKQ